MHIFGIKVIPAPMVGKGNLVANWEFFRQQWEDYEVATGLILNNCLKTNFKNTISVVIIIIIV